MKTLDELAIHHQTDRASVFTRTYGKPHDYARHYDRAFAELRHQPVKLLEIGAAGGEGIKMWLSFFDHPDTCIFGIDNNQGTNPYNTVGSTVNPRYTFRHGDQSDETMWKCFVADHGSDWDILIDDGGHFSNQVITTWRSMFQHVRKGGFYCVEDLEVAYGAGTIFVPPGWENHMNFIKEKIDEINTVGDIESVYLSRGLAIFKR